MRREGLFSLYQEREITGYLKPTRKQIGCGHWLVLRSLSQGVVQRMAQPSWRVSSLLTGMPKKIISQAIPDSFKLIFFFNHHRSQLHFLLRLDTFAFQKFYLCASLIKSRHFWCLRTQIICLFLRWFSYYVSSFVDMLSSRKHMMDCSSLPVYTQICWLIF